MKLIVKKTFSLWIHRFVVEKSVGDGTVLQINHISGLRFHTRKFDYQYMNKVMDIFRKFGRIHKVDEDTSLAMD